MAMSNIKDKSGKFGCRLRLIGIAHIDTAAESGTIASNFGAIDAFDRSLYVPPEHRRLTSKVEGPRRVKALPGRAGRQPEQNCCVDKGNRLCEAYTGSIRAVR
jgi:hypothetical protein